jgi:ankyrin repeat protein
LGNTPLHVACYNGQDVVIEELINNGANVNAANIKGLVSIVRTIFFKLKYRTGQKF